LEQKERQQVREYQGKPLREWAKDDVDNWVKDNFGALASKEVSILQGVTGNELHLPYCSLSFSFLLTPAFTNTLSLSCKQFRYNRKNT
jgi:hypothetical protein